VKPFYLRRREAPSAGEDGAEESRSPRLLHHNLFPAGPSVQDGPQRLLQMRVYARFPLRALMRRGDRLVARRSDEGWFEPCESSANRRKWVKWYSSARWARIRKYQLLEQPLCKYCLECSLVMPATICDHVEPRHGDINKFWFGPFQKPVQALSRLQ
jgi:hypothetical protein